ncbi:DUF2076 domain-containing protein [Pantoea sp. SoEX]|uniref:DUF2076 domain-containing protein n=1 Tax=Pantoea sp. SoEX TaxID=2576763 RepID=UPI0013579331|nr:DUF2076 domain-containing protein [Pantoea sp. SoEX]MXP51475.1 DUF2076 domain-containing protein [Pantoea sp. SoEX]
MQFEEKILIEQLFHRLKKAEDSSSTRDLEAEKKIQDYIKEQPAAPYYMVQSILIQEAALNKLNQQILKLKDEILQLQRIKQNKNQTFLGKLFGRSNTTQETSLNSQSSVSENNNLGINRQQQPYYSSQGYRGGSGGSFMSGALQTAAGVAGGVVIANMLSNMFHHSAPEEIINIIDNPHSSTATENDSVLLNDNLDNTIDHDSYDNSFSNYDDHFSDSDFDMGGFGDDDFV